jgi:hypothetical protein
MFSIVMDRPSFVVDVGVVWAESQVSTHIEKIDYIEPTVFNERLLLGAIAELQALELRRIRLYYYTAVFGCGVLFLLAAILLCLVKSIPYQPPLACLMAVVGIFVVLCMKIRDAKSAS